jgi:hypothetical protein
MAERLKSLRPSLARRVAGAEAIATTVDTRIGRTYVRVMQIPLSKQTRYEMKATLSTGEGRPFS